MSDERILIVQEDGPEAVHLEACLADLGYAVAAVSCGRRALDKARAERPDLALVDLGLEGKISGPETALGLGGGLDVPVVYLTDDAGGERVRRARATRPFGYVLRPFEAGQLDLTIGAALALHERDRRQRQTETRLKRIIRRYKDLTRLMKAVFDSMSEGVVAVDERRRLLFRSASARRIGGDQPVEEDIDKWAQEYGVFGPDGESRVAAEDNPLTRALAGEATDEVEIFVRNEQRPRGVHIAMSGRPLRGKAGAPKGGVLVFRDVTRLKRSEEDLEQALARQRDQAHLMEAIFSSISDAILVADAKGRFLYVNPAAERILGMGLTDGPLEEWAGKYGIHQSDRQTVMKTEDLPLVRAIRRGESTDEEDLFIRNPARPDGVYVRVSARPLLDSGGIRGGVSVFRDVTGRVLAEEALAQAFAQGRLEVVDTILHNIGNAINSVTTGIETLRRNLVGDRVGGRLFALAAAVRDHGDDWIEYVRDDPQGRKVRPFIIELSQGFSRQNEELIRTVSRVRERANHIADIVRTQKTAGASALHRKDVDLHEALAAAVRVLRESLSKRGIDTRIDCRNAPPEIRIQESQFHQMLVNLVKNSIEAIDDLADTRGLEAPRIRIRASVEDPFLKVEVIDNGIGIREGDKDLLFAPGYTTKRRGSGLGLHSAANFVIASGGQIEAVSAGTGRGATMRVTLPLFLVAPQVMAEKSVRYPSFSGR